METILDFAFTLLLKILLPYKHDLATKPMDSEWQTRDSGILQISFPNTDSVAGHFEAFCPEEWSKWKCLDYHQSQTPRLILSNATATTESQMSRMTAFYVGRQLPAFFDLSKEGINMVITSFLEPNQQVLNKIKKELVKELDNIL